MKDEDEEVMTWLENINHLKGKTQLPWLRDRVCFQKFDDEPRYQAVVTALKDRVAAIRQQLPPSLEKQGLLPSQTD